MNWLKLYNALLDGDPGALQTAAIIIYTIVSSIQTWFIAAQFRSQNRFNNEQREINRIAKENQIKNIEPRFQAVLVPSHTDPNKQNIVISLRNANAFSVCLVISDFTIPQRIYTYEEWEPKKDTVTIRDIPVFTELGIIPFYFIIYSQDKDGRKYSKEFEIFNPSSWYPQNELIVRHSGEIPSTVHYPYNSANGILAKD